MSKALGLLSGGLDSSLAALTLKRQGVEVTCIAFVTPFFGSAKAEKAARQMGIPLIVKPIGEIHLEMVKNPHYGYGKNMNPCIDCHAMMFRLAGEVMAEQGFNFLFSGEVLGQRPMSQNLSALQAVAKHSAMAGRILRPLSARLLPETPMEKEGQVDRSRLLDIQGRSRRRQAEFAQAWGLTDYPASGGGCLLTEKSFSGRLRDLFAHQPGATVTDVELLKLGRQFRLSPRAKLSLGRDQNDNRAIEALARNEDVLLRLADFNGPMGLV
ncbi:MAG TPA: thiamine biosynthesis protein, partial [Desulfuromonadales bacterium]